MKTYELMATKQKSFYGKAHVIDLENGTKLLQSYCTIVASTDNKGKLHRHWDGYSLTTMNHIRAFYDDSMKKADWDKLPLEKEPKF